MELSDQQFKALDTNRNIIITAGAGSGKTTVLVKRFLHLLLTFPHLKVHNILAITFTERAAAEMKDRIFAEIEEQFSQNRAQQARLFEILHQLHNAQISTIHAFCAYILRQYPVEANLNPDFRILESIEIDRMLNQVFREFFLNTDFSSHPRSGYIKRALREYSVTKLKKIFLSIYNRRASLIQTLADLNNLSPQALILYWKNLFTDYHQSLFNPLLHNHKFWENLNHLVTIKIDNDSAEEKRQITLRDYVRKYHKKDADQFDKMLSLCHIVQVLTTSVGKAYSRIPGGKKYWTEEGLSLFRNLSEIAADFAQDTLSFTMETEEYYAEIYYGLISLIIEFLTRADRFKASTNLLDFDDLQLETLTLLQKNPEIRDQIRIKFPFILVDEFQDTDELQSTIINFLTHDHQGKLDSNRLFIVGDPKQSIFSFRNADVRIYRKYRDEISTQPSERIPIQVAGYHGRLNASAEERQGLLPIQHNFRSSENLIHFFNNTFSSIFQGNSEYDVEFMSLDPARKSISAQNSSINLDLVINKDRHNGHQAEWQAYQIVKNIRKIVHSDDHQKIDVQDGTPTLSHIDYKDIALLLRYRTHLNTFEQIFRENDIPYHTFKGSGYFQKQEILDIYSLLKSLSFPEDDFALISILRSHFVGLSDACLFYLAQTQGDNYWKKIQNINAYFKGQLDKQRTFSSQFLEFLTGNNMSVNISAEEQKAVGIFVSHYEYWNELAMHGRYSHLLDEIIEKWHIRPLLAHQEDGDQKLANLNKIVQYIFDFESSSSGLILELLDNLKQLISGETIESEALLLAEEENKVRILTYHSAKGMEFPVVMLPLLETPFTYNQQFFTHHQAGFAADLDRSSDANLSRPFLYEYLKTQDRNKTNAEEKRLFYVAATRARDHLYMTGWVQNNSMKDSTYLTWLLRAHELKPDDLTGNGDYPIIKKLGNFYIISHSHEDIADLKKQKPSRYPDSETEQNSFLTSTLKYLEPKPEKPGGQIYSVTKLMMFREDRRRFFRHFYLDSGELLANEGQSEFTDEPGGAEWGTAVHKLLENFQKRSPDDDRQKIQQIIHQLQIPQTSERKNYFEKLDQLIKKFRHTAIGKKLHATKGLSELSLDVKLENFTLRGVFDYLFQNKKGIWEVVDFKTNRITATQVDRTAKKYHFQMQAYGLLLSYYAPDQKFYPVTIHFLEPEKSYRREYALLEIESFRSEILQLLNEIYQYERDIMMNHPVSKTEQK